MPTNPRAASDVRAEAPREVSLAASIHVDRANLVGPVVFAGLFAALSLLILPWPIGAGWFAAVAGWETFYAYVVDRQIRARPDRAGLRLFAASNMVGAVIYCALALMSLREGSPIGVAIGVSWLAGVFINGFAHYGENRLLVWSMLAPAIATGLVGPALGHGVTVESAVISLLILATLAAAGAFSADSRALLTRLVERQTAMVDMESKLALAVDAAGDGLFEVDMPHRRPTVSASWAGMLGYELGDIGEAPLMDYVHPDDVLRTQSEFAAHFSGATGHLVIEHRLRCKDGGYKWVLTRAKLVARTADGKPLKLIGMTTDISARKALELQLETARDVAEHANAAKSMFVANMSHEIRTPLNGVIGVAGVLARTALTGPQQEMVGLVQSSAQVLERLLSDVLDQSKLEAGEFELQVAPFALRGAVEAAAELMRARAEEKGLGFRVSYSAAADGAFEGDAVRLRQIIANLAGNAIKFTEAGEIAIGVDVAAGAAADGRDLVSIEVSDTGIGFDAGTAERLFSRFVQADGSISRRFGGTGLGLAICKALAQLMGGDIAATSQPGAGSTFVVRLPMRRLAEGLGEIAAEAEDGGVELAGLRVLLAEDHPTNQRVIQLILAPFGVDLTVVEDGVAALEALARERFDLVLMDMQMPRMDGLAATREIRERERRRGGAGRTPIAMLTANAMDEHRAQAAAAGADHHIAKPITPGSLLAGIAAALGAAPPGAPAQIDAA